MKWIGTSLKQFICVDLENNKNWTILHHNSEKNHNTMTYPLKFGLVTELLISHN